MESVRSAQIQVDTWVREDDIYSDRPFWQSKVTKQVTYDEPNVYHYLPPGFIIPDPPSPLPSDIEYKTTSSSEESLSEWQRKHGQDREAEQERSLGKSKAKSIRSNAQTRKRNESRSEKKRLTLSRSGTRSVSSPQSRASFAVTGEQNVVSNPMLQSQDLAGQWMPTLILDNTSQTSTDESSIHLPPISNQLINVQPPQPYQSPRPDDMGT